MGSHWLHTESLWFGRVGGGGGSLYQLWITIHTCMGERLYTMLRTCQPVCDCTMVNNCGNYLYIYVAEVVVHRKTRHSYVYIVHVHVHVQVVHVYRELARHINKNKFYIICKLYVHACTCLGPDTRTRTFVTYTVCTVPDKVYVTLTCMLEPPAAWVWHALLHVHVCTCTLHFAIVSGLELLT